MYDKTHYNKKKKKNHWFQEFKGREKTCLILEELLYILPRKLREAAHPTLMPAGGVVWRGERGRYGGAAVRTRVTQPRFRSLVVCGEAVMGLILHEE